MPLDIVPQILCQCIFVPSDAGVLRTFVVDWSCFHRICICLTWFIFCRCYASVNSSSAHMEITVQDCMKNSNKTQESQNGAWMGKTGKDWDGLHLGKFEKRQSTFFKIYVSLYQNIIYTAGKSFLVVMWPWFYKWKPLALPIWRVELIIDKIKQHYLK